MLAAERGAGANTLAAYGRDLADFAAYLARARRIDRARATTDDLRAYLGRLGTARLECGDGGTAAIGDPAALPLSLCGGPAQGRSGRGA